MRLCIVGGALQGMEAVFLGHKAGYETIVIDKRSGAPALSICDEPHVLNPIEDEAAAMEIFEECDAVLPACEEHDLLECLDKMLENTGIPFLTIFPNPNSLPMSSWRAAGFLSPSPGRNADSRLSSNRRPRAEAWASQLPMTTRS